MLITYKKEILKHTFRVDFEFFNEIIVEVKAVDKEIAPEYIAQTLNYLKASGKQVALIINFGRKSLEYQRFVF